MSELRLVHNTPTKTSTDNLALSIRLLWKRGLHTMHIADVMKVPESTVYNTLAAYREQKRGQQSC